MIVKRLGLLTWLVALLLAAPTASAYDFSAPAPGGQTLYYRIVTGGVEVVYPANTVQPVNGWSGFDRPTGALEVPSTVFHNGTTYNVLAINNHAFYGCTGLTAVTVGQGLRAVRNNAFNGCSGLRTAVLPSSVDSLGTTAFGSCTLLDTLTVRRTLPPVCPSSAFNSVPTSTAVLMVPCQCATAYSAVSPWSLFGTIDEEPCSVTLTALPNHAERGSVSGGGLYPVGATATLTALPAEGYFFACWGDGDTLNPRQLIALQTETYVAHFFALRHDTVTLTVTQYDTVHDTVYDLRPQVRLTVVSGDAWRGLVAGNATVPVGTMIEVAAIPLEGSRFEHWSDGETANPRRVTVTEDMTLTAFFGASTGVEAAAAGDWRATVEGRRLTVECAAGETVRLFDTQGRCLAQLPVPSGRCTTVLPSAGVFLVGVGTAPAKKIIVE